ncbi:unnamed protein product [Symbiodinium sp. CCMP2592]|nr:unnamed protein product [Symbiodinium sp. CCMP2592]
MAYERRVEDWVKAILAEVRQDGLAWIELRCQEQVLDDLRDAGIWLLQHLPSYIGRSCVLEVIDTAATLSDAIGSDGWGPGGSGPLPPPDSRVKFTRGVGAVGQVPQSRGDSFWATCTRNTRWNAFPATYLLQKGKDAMHRLRKFLEMGGTDCRAAVAASGFAGGFLHDCDQCACDGGYHRPTETVRVMARIMEMGRGLSSHPRGQGPPVVVDVDDEDED